MKLEPYAAHVVPIPFGESIFRIGALPGPSVMIRTKRVYDAREKSDGSRILVDRLWPRGISKQKADIDAWEREIAPSNDLRKWYQHDPEKWAEFKMRYEKELDSKDVEVKRLLSTAKNGTLTLVFSSKETERNNAVALKEYLDGRLGSKGSVR